MYGSIKIPLEEVELDLRCYPLKGAEDGKLKPGFRMLAGPAGQSSTAARLQFDVGLQSKLTGDWFDQFHIGARGVKSWNLAPNVGFEGSVGVRIGITNVTLNHNGQKVESENAVE